jgi:hypothetical protein
MVTRNGTAGKEAPDVTTMAVPFVVTIGAARVVSPKFERFTLPMAYS